MSSSTVSLSDPTRARYETLLEISESISSHRQLSSLFNALYRCLRPLVNFDFIGLVLYDPERRVTTLHELVANQPTNCTTPSDRALGETPAEIVLDTQQPYYVPDVRREPNYRPFYEMLLSNGIHAYCLLPLSTAQRRIGGLNFGSVCSGAYSAGDIEFMQHVARQVAVAVDNALNHEAAARYERQLARERDRLQLLLEVNNAVVSNLDINDLFRAISASLKSRFGIEFASIEAGDYRFEPPDSKAGHVVSLPLVHRNQTLVTLNLGGRHPDLFSREDRALLAQAASQIAIAVDNALSYQRIEKLNAQLAEEKIYLEDEIRSDHQFREIVGESRTLKAILKQIETVAPTDSTVIVFGETGTGKELVARALHELSGRRQGTFVKLNCAAIPTGLLESEMFGHEKGAFTGAIAQRIGRFELAHRGTVFLDEVGEIPLELQTKLLRVLQEREFERLGSSRTLRTDARVVAATNRNLEEMVQAREFRSDLYYRLNVFPVRVPPLRDRPEDIPVLVRYFVQQFARRMHKRIESIAAGGMQAMTRYRWPGNVRELQNFIERAVILSAGPALQVPTVELEKSAAVAASAASGGGTLEDVEREAILSAVRESGGRIGGDHGAAARLGMKRTTLQAKMRKLGLTGR